MFLQPPKPGPGLPDRVDLATGREQALEREPPVPAGERRPRRGGGKKRSEHDRRGGYAEQYVSLHRILPISALAETLARRAREVQRDLAGGGCRPRGRARRGRDSPPPTRRSGCRG